MDSYLIRIYRRDKENPEAIVGIIEEIGAEKKQSFGKRRKRNRLKHNHK